MKLTSLHRFTFLSLLALALSTIGWTQTAPAGGVTFGTYAGPMALCLGGSCNVGTLSKEELSITPNLNVGSTQVIVPAINLQGYYGHVAYSIAWESLFKNTLIPNRTLQFSFHGAPGVVNNGSTSAPGTPHFGGIGGLDINYSPTSSGNFILAGRVDGVYAPGFKTSPWGEGYEGFIGYLFGGTKSPTASTAVRHRFWGSKN